MQRDVVSRASAARQPGGRASALLGDAGRARKALRDAHEAASEVTKVSGFSTWSCPRPRQALYALSVALRLRDADEALRASDAADAAWEAGDPWLYGVWSLVRIGSETAHVIKDDLDAAADQLGAVAKLDPPFRISTITGYLADMDLLLRQRRFAGSAKAQELREEIRVLTARMGPVQIMMGAFFAIPGRPCSMPDRRRSWSRSCTQFRRLRESPSAMLAG